MEIGLWLAASLDFIYLFLTPLSFSVRFTSQYKFVQIGHTMKPLSQRCEGPPRAPPNEPL